MTMVSGGEYPGGKLPTSDELFQHCAALAANGLDCFDQARYQHDEVNRVLQDIKAFAATVREDLRRNAEGTRVDLRSSIVTAQESLQASTKAVVDQGAQLKEMYAPEAVTQATVRAETLVTALEKKVAGLTQQVNAAAQETVVAFSKRAVVAAAICSVFLLLLGGLAFLLIPSLDEISRRRAEYAEWNQALAQKKALLSVEHQVVSCPNVKGRMCVSIDPKVAPWNGQNGTAWAVVAL